jgi:D-alanyl-D-alanine carboxypeptidase
MKKIIFHTGLILSILILNSCTEITTEPVSDCTFIDLNDVNNPNKDLYQAILDEYVDMGIPGISVAIYTPEDGWWVGCSGLARIEDETDLESCHLFHSASIAKTYTATMVLHLIEEGTLNLEDPIKDYLPEKMANQIKNTDEITIHQLLNHTSGLWYFRDYQWRYDSYNEQMENSTVESFYESYVYGKPVFSAPGEQFNYTDLNFVLLAKIIEAVTGESVDEYMTELISEPLGLANTFIGSANDYPDEMIYLANAYWEFYKGQIQNCTEIQNENAPFSIGATGVIATPYEYARFIQELGRGNILTTATLDIMLAEDHEFNEIATYSLGVLKWNLGDRLSFGHFGKGRGHSGIFLYFPEEDVCLAILCNIGSRYSSDNTRRFGFDVPAEFVNVIFNGKRGTDLD